ncbi:hypothetical protein ILUMI_21766 [Ignelater luminosus]|uniref:Ephrin RBD domain-containing protein n=1 Tax=Ignelater luminosus TaxID=2038154 RepID=A0A8K0CFL9_IGNLU|nr:hypothetical protein ILUMI_21766 [Ignelater luminosus]
MAVLVKKCGITLPGFKITSCLTVLLICLETVLLCTESTCSKSFYVHWNTTNSIFRIDNTDHIIDVNKGNVQFEYDQVNIICPVYMPGTYDEDAEKYIIYNVSKEEYETCRITNPNPRIIAICDKPYKLMYFTITFRPFTPQPGGLEFLPGKDYYFISTSSKDDLHRRIGGRCSTHNMKIVFKVCCKQEDTVQNNSTTRSATTSTTALSWPMGPTPDLTTTPTTTHLITKQETPQSTRKPTKKTNEYDKQPNEVVKNEELTYNSGVWLSAASPSVLMVVICIACWRWR